MDTVYQIVDHHLIFHVHGKEVDIDLRKLIWPASAFSVFYLLFWKKSGFEDMNKVKKLTKVQSKDEPTEDDKPYQPQPINIPALKGWLSMIYRKLLRSPFGRSFLVENSKRQGGLDLFLKLHLPDKPTYFPIVYPDEWQDSHLKENIDLWKIIKPSETSSFHFNTISDYVDAYRNGYTTPTEVAKSVIKAIKHSESLIPRMRIIIEYHEDDILFRAVESTHRWQDNKPLSVFDGVPVAVKDEVFLAGYPCRAGLPLEEFSKKKDLVDEGWMIRKLREGGAVFIGMANMHQLGVGITGINPSRFHGTARCPYNPDFPPGGSSSGPAAAVASGLCPVGVAADGGGSIRIPAALNGIIGAKASFSRISQTGLHQNCDTVSHTGAICATTRDSAIFYGFVAGVDPDYPLGHIQPSPCLFQFEETNLSDITIGIDWAYFNDCLPEISVQCKKVLQFTSVFAPKATFSPYNGKTYLSSPAVEYLVSSSGATVEEISIPELQESARAHVVATLTEMYTYSKEIYHRYHDDINTDTEINLGLGSSLTASEYFLAQKQRTRSMSILKRLFKKVDCIITPTHGDFLPRLDADILKYGYNNLKHLTDMIRFNVLGNLAGHPSISVPVGYSKDNHLPIGILIQTAWWREDLMFRIAHAMEGFCQLKSPQVYYDVLSKKWNGGDSKTNSPSSTSPML